MDNRNWILSSIINSVTIFVALFGLLIIPKSVVGGNTLNL